MVNKEYLTEINSFLDYNYIPFNKAQCVKRLLLVWLFSIIVCFIGKPVALWFLLLGLADVFISSIFIVLIVKYAGAKGSRYLCDGIFCLYLALFLDIASYRVLALQIGPNWIIGLILIFLLFLCIFFSFLIINSFIKSGKYTEKKGAGYAALPYIGGLVGVIAARFFLNEQNAFGALSICLLLISFVMAFCSLNLYRFYLYRRYVKEEI